MRKTYLAAAASLGALLMASTPASALVFELNNVSFIDGATLTGTFETSDDLNTLMGFSFVTSDGTNFWGQTFPGDSYGTGGREATAFQWSKYIGFSAEFSDPFAQIGLLFAGPLTANGVSLIGADEALNPWGLKTRVAVGGSITPLAAVPEPATWAMMIGGLALVGLSMRRRKVTVSFA